MENNSSTVGQSTFQTIKEDIIFGILKPGLKLKLSVLKDQYKASVSILRETLNRLASEGFVEAKDQRGFYVATTSKEDFLEIANTLVKTAVRFSPECLYMNRENLAAK